MNNLNNLFIKPAKKPSNNKAHHCPLKVGLPLWIDNQPFWTYQCSCGHYQFSKGKVGGFEGGIDE